MAEYVRAHLLDDLLAEERIKVRTAADKQNPEIP